MAARVNELINNTVDISMINYLKDFQDNEIMPTLSS